MLSVNCTKIIFVQLRGLERLTSLVVFAGMVYNVLVTAIIGLLVPLLGVLTWFVFDKKLKKEEQAAK